MNGLGIISWFSEGSIALQVFRIIAVGGLFMALIQVFLRLFGVGHHDIDFSGDADHHGGDHILSWTTVSGFALGLGSVGMMMLQRDYTVASASLAGGFVGILLGGLLLFVLRGLNRMKEDNTFDIRNCVGLVGTAYIRIPAKQSGGQIQIVAQSRMVTLSAVSDQEIASGEKVKVIEVVGTDTVKVERA